MSEPVTGKRVWGYPKKNKQCEARTTKRRRCRNAAAYLVCTVGERYGDGSRTYAYCYQHAPEFRIGRDIPPIRAVAVSGSVSVSHSAAAGPGGTE